MNTGHLFRLVEDEAIEVIDLKLCNLFGGYHHISLPAKKLNDDLFKRGIGVDSSSIPGFKTAGVSDMSLLPDPSTSVIDPFGERRTLTLLGSLIDAETGEPFRLDPRYIVQRAEDYMIETGIADRSQWGPEFEFYIFEAVHINNRINEAYYNIESAEAGWHNQDFSDDDDSSLIPRKGGYHVTPPRDRYFNLRDRMSAVIEQYGIPVKYHHHEVGGSGQSEIEIELLPALQACDAVMAVKYIAKNLARQAGYSVTFMPKPLYNEAGSGMHFHQHLFNGDTPLFYDGTGYYGLSQSALYYIGGLLKHGPALLAVTNPSTNSYRRLLPGFEAPVKAVFGPGNRAAAVRIPKYANKPMEKRIEFRPPDATCNPYLAVAAQLMAGIDGIINEIDPSEHGFGPYDSDITGSSLEKADEIPSLPSSLDEAIEALQEDHDFLMKGDVFTADFFDNWFSKLKNDIRMVHSRPHPYEMEMYFNV